RNHGCSSCTSGGTTIPESWQRHCAPLWIRPTRPSKLHTMTGAATHETRQPEQQVGLVRFVGYFLWLGSVGFGGPIALAGHMQQDLVDERGWISREDYVE